MINKYLKENAINEMKQEFRDTFKNDEDYRKQIDLLEKEKITDSESIKIHKLNEKKKVNQANQLFLYNFFEAYKRYKRKIK